MQRIIAFAAAAVGVAAATPAAALVTTLDFPNNICGVSGDQACGNGSRIGQNYGDSASLDVGYRSINVGDGSTFEPFLKYWSTNYGDLLGVVWGGANATDQRSEIVLTAASGFEVSLISLDAGCYLNRASCQIFNYDIRSLLGDVIAVGSTPTLFPGHATLAVGGGYFGGIVLQWGPDGYDVGLDNIAFDVRAIDGPPPPVPEPAAWGLMVAGLGVLGGALRRRRRLATVAA